jgi:ubiquinone/menaquinone biosynthesis C-methylase UbiE
MDTTYLKPEEWDKLCLIDEARNSFAIPVIQSCIGATQPKHIADIGCGTGYISRTILEAGFGRESSWLLLDHNRELLNYAREMFADAANVDCLEADIRSSGSGYSGERNDFAFICYSLLEVAELDLFLEGLNSILSNQAQVVLIYPDVMEDIEAESFNDSGLITQYRMGSCVISKLNKFTGQRQDFFAHRIEDIIEGFCGLHFHLSDFQSYLTQNQRRHFALIFVRS